MSARCSLAPSLTPTIAPATAGTGSTVPGAAESAQAYTTGQYLKGSTGQSLTIFGGEETAGARLIYVLVGLSALYQLIPLVQAFSVGEVYAEGARSRF